MPAVELSENWSLINTEIERLYIGKDNGPFGSVLKLHPCLMKTTQRFQLDLWMSLVI